MHARSLIYIALFRLRKKKASQAMGLAMARRARLAEFCTFFVDKIVRKARHAILSP